MQLKRLEAYGFKSFADRTEIEFDKGVTAIVGPNGSGKSNITDAIRWVLGEQNVRNLRGTKSEDVIFTGSSSRRPLGVAEVSVSFINDGTLPLDFDEVVVTRRYFRSGESEYYINKARCRLKDIYALFADTGLGQDGMSVISQNKIDEILNSKPEERRLFFEETAGITKYRSRKKEAMHKLEGTEQNYLRVNDIVQEIESQLEPLAEQAERTRKYNGLKAEYHKCVVTELCDTYQRLSGAKERYAEQLEEIKDREVGIAAEKHSAEAEKESVNNEVLQLENELQILAADNAAVHEKIEAAVSEVRLFEERREQRDANRKRLAEQKAMIGGKITAAESERDELKEEAERLAKEQEAFKGELEIKRSAAKELSGKIRQQKGFADELRNKREVMQQDISEKQKAYALLERDIEADMEMSRRRGESEASVRASYEANKQKCAETEKEFEQLTAERTVVADNIRSFTQKQKKLIDDTNRFRQMAGAAKQYAEMAETKLDVLKNMQQAYEGFGKAAKAVLKSHDNWRSRVCGAVAELINVPQKYITAVDVALGAGSQNIVTEDAETAKLAIAFLKRGNFGRVTFLPLDTLEIRKPPEVFLRAAGVVGWLNEVVSVEEKYQKAIDFLLARTLLVDTLDHALALAKKQGHRVRIVTLEGELLNPGGSISGGSYKQQESGFLNRAGEIASLSQAYETKQKEAVEHLQRLDEVKNELERVNTQLADSKELQNELSVKDAKLRLDIGNLTEKVNAEAKELDEIAEWKTRRELTFAKAQERKVLAMREIRSLETEAGELQNDIAKAKEILNELEEEADELGKTINDGELRNAVMGQGIIRNKEKALLIARNIEQLEKERADCEKEIVALVNSDEEGREQLQKIKDEKIRLELLWQEGREKQQAVYDKKMQRLVDGQEIDRKIAELGQQLTKIAAKLHSLELEASKVDYELEQCRQTLQEEYKKTPEEAKNECLDMKTAAVKQYKEEIKEQIAVLGQVNPQAIEEYENRKERYDFLKKQLDDLAAAKQNLLQLVKEINQTMIRQFNEVFERIKIAFNDIFVELFGGGKAELELTDYKDVLNSGVEINVQIPEKKQQNLSVLSGGERALTVIALLFAFLRVKPAPFSVLDEIDAPLDEANIARFSRFLHDFANNTQFIIVTHRKRTMEAADVMYGVTLEDAGVSKLISVRLSER